MERLGTLAQSLLQRCYIVKYVVGLFIINTAFLSLGVSGSEENGS